MAKRKYTDQQVIDAVKESHSIAEVCRKVGLSEHGSNPTTIKKIITNLNLDTSHFTGQAWAKGKNSDQDSRIRKKDISEILIKDSGWSSHAVKLKLLDEGIKEYRCERCGNTEWNEQLIPLELHHLNGDHHDNRLENLQVLCPNCHAQTDNYSGGKISNPNSNREPKHKCSKCGKPLNGKRKTSLCNDCYKEIKHELNTHAKIEKTCSICGKVLNKATKSGMCKDCYNKQRAVNSNCPFAEELLEKKKELKSYVKIGEFYNTSDKTIKKWFKARNLI